MPVGLGVFVIFCGMLNLHGKCSIRYDRRMDSWDIVIVGGGPAGLMAGARCAMRGKRTLLLEKNRKPGVKILLSGGTRCNFTHATDERGIVEAFGPSGRFLHSALAAFGPQDIVDFFQSEGVSAKIEPDTGKIFPASDRASDILAVLLRRLRQSGCTLATEEPLQNIEQIQDGFLLTTPQRTIFAAKGFAGDRRKVVSGLRHDRRRLSLGRCIGSHNCSATHRASACNDSCRLGHRASRHNHPGCFGESD